MRFQVFLGMLFLIGLIFPDFALSERKPCKINDSECESVRYLRERYFLDVFKNYKYRTKGRIFLVSPNDLPQGLSSDLVGLVFVPDNNSQECEVDKKSSYDFYVDYDVYSESILVDGESKVEKMMGISFGKMGLVRLVKV